jgi:hypothetical protein
MTRRITLLVAALAVAGLIAMVPLGAAVTGDSGAPQAIDDAAAGEDAPVTRTAPENDTRTSRPANATANLSPGERLSGVIGVQAAEIDGEVSSRSLEIRLAEAETDAERAAVIAAQLERNERRLAELRERQRELRERREAGDVSPGAYAARKAAIGTRAAVVNRTTNRSAAVATGLPAEALAERGVDAARIRTLRRSASELSGPETAAIAREIGGNRTGAPMGPDRRGPPGSGGGPPGTDADPGADASGPRNASAGDDPARGGPDRGARSGRNAAAGSGGAGNATAGNATAGGGNGVSTGGPAAGDSASGGSADGDTDATGAGTADGDDGSDAAGSDPGDATGGSDPGDATGGSDPGDGAGESDPGGDAGDGAEPGSGDGASAGERRGGA